MDERTKIGMREWAIVQLLEHKAAWTEIKEIVKDAKELEKYVMGDIKE